MSTPRTRVYRATLYGAAWWVVENCRCYDREPHTERRYTANSAWLIIRQARNWADRRRLESTMAGMSNAEAVARYGNDNPNTARIN